MQIPPPTRSSSRGPAIVLGIAAVMILGGLVAIAAWGFNAINAARSATPTPAAAQSAALPTVAASASTTNRLAVIDGGRIYSVDPDGDNEVSFDVNGVVPTAALIWSHDGARLLYVTVDSRSGRLLSVRPDGSDERVLYEAAHAEAPFFLYGSPDDSHVAFLIPDQIEGIDLQVAETDRAGSARSVIRGQPNYASWSPDGSALLLHVGGSSPAALVGTYQIGDAAPRLIESSPALFQAPAWSPAGAKQWLYARQQASRSDLIVSDGVQTHTITHFDSGIIFSWSPDGQHIAYALNTPDSFLYSTLTVVDDQGHAPRVYFNGDVLGFFWSPDGRKLAYLTGVLIQPGPIGRAKGLAASRIGQTGTQLELTWHVIDLETQAQIDLASFEPTDSFLYLIQYSDQFAQSIELWSPDSRSLVYTGSPLVGKSGVYVVDAVDQAKPAYVGPGDFAIWSWH